VTGTPGLHLRHLLATRPPVLAPGAANALTARIIADCGFDVVYVSGAAVANWSLGVPDLGLTSMQDVLTEVARVCDAVDLPVVADADAGYGNALNVRRTVREFERAGVAAIQIEDQVDPKRCGHFEGKEVIPAREMLAKITSFLDARRSDDLMLIARTDARSVEGLDRAVERACSYHEAGADAVFVEAPLDIDELARVGREVPGLLVANMVEGGKTPIVARDELGELGFHLVIYANVAARAAMQAMKEVLSALRDEGSSSAIVDRIVTMTERNRLTGMDEWRAMEARYRAE
jgi:2-methylisocitrate lyase-like PEP mutase family enzyme